MAWTVADAVAVFDVIAGYDPADPVTAASQGKRPDSYMKFLDKEGVRGTRIGVVRQLFTPQNTDLEVMKRMEQTLSSSHGWALRLSIPSPSPRSTRSRRPCLLASGSSSTSTNTCRGSPPTRRSKPWKTSSSPGSSIHQLRSG